jgi:hypothetical protein
MSTVPEIESADKQDTVHNAVPVLDTAEPLRTARPPFTSLTRPIQASPL